MKSLITVISLLVLPAAAVATEACQELVQKCYGSTSPSEQSNCFFESSTNKACVGSSWESLLKTRWTMGSPESDDGLSKSILGPLVVDQRCVSDCDATTQSKILSEGILSESQIQAMTACYQGCRKETPPRFLQP